uniref:Uncharacterized protein n=1 Tax=Trichogramma kaykai TaxID=54128 RepID=A0ABD2X198_9HYME
MKSDLIRTSQRETRECVYVSPETKTCSRIEARNAQCVQPERLERKNVYSLNESSCSRRSEKGIREREREREMRTAKNDVDNAKPLRDLLFPSQPVLYIRGAHQICEITAAQSINRKVVERRGQTIILALRTSSIAATCAYMASSGKRRVLGEKRKQSREFKRGARRPEPIDALLPKLSRANFKDCERIAHSVLYYFSRIRGMWNSWIPRLFSDQMKNHEWSISCPRRRGSNAYLRKELNYAYAHITATRIHFADHILQWTRS